jgi:hypothetical protein
MEDEMNSFRNALATAGVAAGLGLGAVTTASANGFCDAQVASYRGELEAKAAPVLAEVDQGISDIRKGGGDPDQIGVRMPNGQFKTLPELKSMLLTQKAEVAKQIDDKADDCSRDLKPYQAATDAAVTIGLGGLNKLLPERMTHIEIGEVLAGKPLGGAGGLVPHFREQVFAAVGLLNDRGFVTTVIRDPVQTVIKAPGQLVKQWFPHW